MKDQLEVAELQIQVPSKSERWVSQFSNLHQTMTIAFHLNGLKQSSLTHRMLSLEPRGRPLGRYLCRKRLLSLVLSLR